jgi:hypothetical protein
LVPINFILNVIHGFFGMIYYGAVLLFGLFFPKLEKLEKEEEILTSLFPSLVSFIESTGMITVVFGAGEFIHYMIGYYKDGGMQVVQKVLLTGWGFSILVGGILGLAGFFVGLNIAFLFERIFKAYKSIDPSSIEEINMLKEKLSFYSKLGAILLTLSVIFMILGVSFLPLPQIK